MVKAVTQMADNHEMMKAALEYISQGFKVFPVKLDKTPYTPHGLRDATQTVQGVREYWTKYPDAGIGIVTDDSVVLDFDAKSGGLDSLQVIEKKYGLPLTRVHITGGRGFHYIYHNPDGRNIRNATKFLGYAGVDLRANGGYIVAPPSPHLSGNDYAVYTDIAPTDASLWLLEAATVRTPAKTAASDTDTIITQGTRNDTLTRLAGTMRNRGMSAEAIEAALLAENKQKCNPPLTDNEVINIARSVSRYEPAVPDSVEAEHRYAEDNVQLILDHGVFNFYFTKEKASIIVSDIQDKGRGIDAEFNVEYPVQIPFLNNIRVNLYLQRDRRQLAVELAQKHTSVTVQWDKMIDYVIRILSTIFVSHRHW